MLVVIAPRQHDHRNGEQHLQWHVARSNESGSCRAIHGSPWIRGSTAAALPWMLAIVSSVMMASQACAQEDIDLERRFLQEAPKKWDEWMKIARETPLQMDCRIWQSPAGTPLGPVPSLHLQTKRNAAGTLLLSLVEDTSINQCRCCALNRRYAFELRRQTPSDPWLLASIQKDPQVKDPTSINVMLGRNSTGVQANGPFVLYKYNAASLVREPGFKVKTITALEQEGRRLAQVHFICSRTSNSTEYSDLYHYEDGWLVLDPDRWWSVVRYEANVAWPRIFTQSIRTHVQGAIECGETSSGLTIMKSEVIRLKGSGKGINLDLDYQAKYVFEERVPDQEEFTLTAFGLPEPTGLNNTPSLYMWVFAAAALCGFAAAIIFWRRGRVPSNAGT